jgi:hypothetical protein
MLVDDLQVKMVGAMKAGDKARANTFRNLMSEIKNVKIDNPNMSNEDEVAVVKKEAKKRRDSIEALRQAQGKPTSSSEEGLLDKLNLEQEELKILEEFMPPEMGDEELSSIVHEAIIYLSANGIGDMGRVMGEVMSRVGGKASGDRVAPIVRHKLLNGNS